MAFKIGDKVRVVEQHWGGPEVGKTATITRGDYSVSGAYDAMVDVRWDDGYLPNGGTMGWFATRFELIEGARNVDSDVDELINRYASNLRKAINGGTMVEPYSEIGVFASFLMDYKRLGE